MEKVSRQRLVDQVEERLLGEIASGALKEILPSTRVLASSMGVSAPTMAAAIKRLVGKGYLIHRGQRRSYGIASQARKNAVLDPTRRKQLLLVTHVELDKLDAQTREILRQFLGLLVASGWGYESRVIDYLRAKTIHKSWSSGLDPSDYDMAIVVSARPSIMEWLEQLNLPYAALGGDSQYQNLPITGVSIVSVVRSGLERLMMLGHERIYTPLCEQEEATIRKVRDTYAEVYASRAVSYFENQQTPVSEYSARDVLWGMTAKAFESVKPTAIILFDWKEFMTISCLLQKLGLEIPRDVSVLLMNYNPMVEWYVPRIASFQYPVQRLAKQLMRWVEQVGYVEPGSYLLEGYWRDAESIAAVPAKGSNR